MENKANQKYIEEIINLEDLTGHGSAIQLDDRRPDGQSLDRVKIFHSNSTALCQNFQFVEIVNGFTPGALKNIIALSERKLRVYAVTKNQISFLSCSDLPEEISKPLYNKESSLLTTMNFSPKNSTIHIFSTPKNFYKFFYRIKLCSLTGKILNTDQIKWSYIKILSRRHTPQHSPSKTPS